jgi:hypothetical protein
MALAKQSAIHARMMAEHGPILFDKDEGWGIPSRFWLIPKIFHKGH